MDDIYNAWYWFDHWNERLMIGAGWTNHTVCRGDSGGPLTVDRNGVTVLVGVVSFGDAHWYNGVPSCDQPGAYAELSGAQLAWVATTVPGVAARWGACEARRSGSLGPRSVGGTLGRWVATYWQGDDDLEIVQPETWSFSCVPNEPVTTAPGIAPRFDSRQTLPAIGPSSIK
jgi:secreted trypsin-like serine protease